ncbi:hypothetical protein NELON_06145 [Neisseria elongata subsp. glycolytica ATCC 29315]|uniref:Uncharacterized protein n=1 Tax=Neisseria elongata subsp. glycolytica ATCC 29315 TaxID=546263 RepID=A0A0B5CHK4_NEIEG|nr:hypothetical protein NELON_06145 [Neisseria elongata subsp. glycolytica ATCC 29315]
MIFRNSSFAPTSAIGISFTPSGLPFGARSSRLLKLPPPLALRNSCFTSAQPASSILSSVAYRINPACEPLR